MIITNGNHPGMPGVIVLHYYPWHVRVIVLHYYPWPVVSLKLGIDMDS